MIKKYVCNWIMAMAMSLSNLVLKLHIVFLPGPVLKASERPSSQMSFEGKKGRLDE
jgi:hypothetical protein